MNKIMRQATLCVGVLIGSLITSGCGPSSHPGTWDEAKVETELTRTLKLESLDLMPSDGGFQGTGSNSDGQSFEVTVKQDAATKSLTYDAKGNRGENVDGTIEFD